MITANGKTRCPCITGCNLAGRQFGDDYSEQATEEEMRKLWEKFVKIHNEKERRWLVEEFSMRNGIRTWANGEKQKVKMEAMQH